MGQKSNPIGLRLGINRSWDSNWFRQKDYADVLIEDLRIRQLIKGRIFYNKMYSRVEISDIIIKRFPGLVNIYISASRPGLLIGKRGGDIEELKKFIKDKLKLESEIKININEVRKIDLDANILAQMVGKMVEGRRSYKKAMKQAISRAINAGAKGVKVRVAGRLGGSEMARREQFREGSIPLHTFDAMVAYGHYDAKTLYGIIGVSVWVYTENKSKTVFKNETFEKLSAPRE